jgi:hypothetical protein
MAFVQKVGSRRTIFEETLRERGSPELFSLHTALNTFSYDRD